MEDETPRSGKGRAALVAAIAVGLALVVLAPIALSSSHIYQWANSPTGLDLPPVLAVAAFVALDLVAITCVAMNVYASLRGDTAPVFVLLTWLFAGGSAWINYQSATTTPTPLDGQFFASMSLAGPVMLEATLAKLRKWTRRDAGTAASQRPKFGDRWAVAPRETFRAWKAARREDISSPAEAIAFVREVEAIEGMDDTDSARYAVAALGSADEYEALRWLQSRGRVVQPWVVAEAVAERSRPSGRRARPAVAADRSEAPTRPVEIPGPRPVEIPAPRPVPAALAELPDNRSRVRAILEEDPHVNGAEVARRINAVVGPDTLSPERGRTLRREVLQELELTGGRPVGRETVTELRSA
jgi:hypothetical protein